MAERRGARGPSPYFNKDSLCSSSLSGYISLRIYFHQSGEYCMRARGQTVDTGFEQRLCGISSPHAIP